MYNIDYIRNSIQRLLIIRYPAVQRVVHLGVFTPYADSVSFSSFAIDAAQVEMASQSRKSPTGDFTVCNPAQWINIDNHLIEDHQQAAMTKEQDRVNILAVSILLDDLIIRKIFGAMR